MGCVDGLFVCQVDARGIETDRLLGARAHTPTATQTHILEPALRVVVRALRKIRNKYELLELLLRNPRRKTRKMLSFLRETSGAALLWKNKASR